MIKAFEIFHEGTPSYVCAVLDVGTNVLDAMREALSLERKTGCIGWMIRDFRGAAIREYPAFISKPAA